jgi:hypothetical protein
VQGVWAALVLPDSQPLWLRAAVAVSGLVSGLVAGAAAGAWLRLGGAPPRRPRRVPAPALTVLAAVSTAVAVLAGPFAADVWTVRQHAGAFDLPFSAAGTGARPSAAALAVWAGTTPGYGGTIYDATPANWQRQLAFGTEMQLQEKELLGTGRPAGILVFSSAEASFDVAAGVPGVIAVGGFTGDVPSPTVGQVQALLDAGRVNIALIPSELELDGNDPRVQAVVHACDYRISLDRGSVLEYLCGNA